MLGASNAALGIGHLGIPTKFKNEDLLAWRDSLRKVARLCPQGSDSRSRIQVPKVTRESCDCYFVSMGPMTSPITPRVTRMSAGARKLSCANEIDCVALERIPGVTKIK